MPRFPGSSAYPNKHNVRSICLTDKAVKILERAERRTARKGSEIVEHALRAVGPTIKKSTPKIGAPGVFGPDEQDRRERRKARRKVLAKAAQNATEPSQDATD